LATIAGSRTSAFWALVGFFTTLALAGFFLALDFSCFAIGHLGVTQTTTHPAIKNPYFEKSRG
jgi:hypothetical protein